MRSLTLLMAALVALAPAPVVLAQGKGDQAKDSYNRGKEHFKAGNYREALVELKKAYELKPHPALLRYMGDTYYKMNKARWAIQMYRRYLKEAPMAADKDKIEAKVRQLELIVGTGEEEEEETGRTAPAPAPTPAPAPAPRKAEPVKPEPKIDLRPTGDDTENPLAHPERRRIEEEKPVVKKGKSGLTIAKWVFLGAGVAAMIPGIALNVMASSKASELEDAVKTECPANQPNCPGNPSMDKPMVTYSKTHYEMEQAYQQYQAGSIASFVTGGVLLGISAVLFIVDATGKEKRAAGSARHVVLAPVLDGTSCGLAGQVSF